MFIHKTENIWISSRSHFNPLTPSDLLKTYLENCQTKLKLVPYIFTMFLHHCNFGRKKSYIRKKEKMPRQHMTLLTHETKEASEAYNEDLQVDFKNLFNAGSSSKKIFK